VRAGPLALTLGDPAGVGPEIVVKAWNELRRSGPTFVVVGDYQSVASASGASNVRRVLSPVEALAIFEQALPVIDLLRQQRPEAQKRVQRKSDLRAGRAFCGNSPQI